jgi:hypothetical protein
MTWGCQIPFLCKRAQGRCERAAVLYETAAIISPLPQDRSELAQALFNEPQARYELAQVVCEDPHDRVSAVEVLWEDASATLRARTVPRTSFTGPVLARPGHRTRRRGPLPERCGRMLAIRAHARARAATLSRRSSRSPTYFLNDIRHARQDSNLRPAA